MKKLFFSLSMLMIVSLTVFGFSVQQKRGNLKGSESTGGAVGTIRFIVTQNGTEPATRPKYVKAKFIVTNQLTKETIVLSGVNMKLKKGEYVSQLVRLEAGPYKIDSVTFFPVTEEGETPGMDIHPNLVLPYLFTVQE